MADRTRTKDKSSLHLCRIELPNLVDDMQLSVYAFRLYVRIKRVAQDEGSCWQSARTLAAACCMSPGQVSKAKEELVERGLIVRQTKTVRGGQVDDITIVDIWPQNFRTYASESDHGANTSSESDHTANTFTESDHHTIASQNEAIVPRSLSGESDQEVIGLSIKRSHSDRKNHVGVVGVGDRARENLFAELRGRKISRKSAEAICALTADDATILTSIDNLYDPSDPRTMGGVIQLLLDAPPKQGTPYERQPPRDIAARPEAADPADSGRNGARRASGRTDRAQPARAPRPGERAYYRRSRTPRPDGATDPE